MERKEEPNADDGNQIGQKEAGPGPALTIAQAKANNGQNPQIINGRGLGGGLGPGLGGVRTGTGFISGTALGPQDPNNFTGRTMNSFGRSGCGPCSGNVLGRTAGLGLKRVDGSNPSVQNTEPALQDAAKPSNDEEKNKPQPKQEYVKVEMAKTAVDFYRETIKDQLEGKDEDECYRIIGHNWRSVLTDEERQKFIDMEKAAPPPPFNPKPIIPDDPPNGPMGRGLGPMVGGLGNRGLGTGTRVLHQGNLPNGLVRGIGTGRAGFSAPNSEQNSSKPKVETVDDDKKAQNLPNQSINRIDNSLPKFPRSNQSPLAGQLKKGSSEPQNPDTQNIETPKQEAQVQPTPSVQQTCPSTNNQLRQSIEAIAPNLTQSQISALESLLRSNQCNVGNQNPQVCYVPIQPIIYPPIYLSSGYNQQLPQMNQPFVQRKDTHDKE